MRPTKRPKLKALQVVLIVLSVSVFCSAQTRSSMTAEPSHANRAEIKEKTKNAILPTYSLRSKDTKILPTQNREGDSARQVSGGFGDADSDGVSSRLLSEHQDSETLKALEIANIRLAAANEKNALLEKRIEEKDAVIAAREGELTARKEQLTDLRTANKERAFVNNGDARMLEAANQIIAKQDAEIAKLRNPGILRSIFDTRTAYGAIAGFGVCKLTTGSNPTIQVPNPFGFQATSEDRAKQAMRMFTK